MLKLASGLVFFCLRICGSQIGYTKWHGRQGSWARRTVLVPWRFPWDGCRADVSPVGDEAHLVYKLLWLSLLSQCYIIISYLYIYTHTCRIRKQLYNIYNDFVMHICNAQSWQLNVYASINRIDWEIDRQDGQHVWMSTSWEGVVTTYYTHA